MTLYDLAIALMLGIFLVCTYRSQETMTQRERYGALLLIFVWLLALDKAMLCMPSVAWRFAGYFAMVVTVIVCGITFVHVRKNCAKIRRVLLFTKSQRCIGRDGNLYLRTYDDDHKPILTLIAIYP